MQRYVQCPICEEYLPLKEFALFECGHGLCLSTNQCFQKTKDDPSCPLCRQKKIMVDCPPEKLYLQLDDTPQLRIACAIDHLGRIDAEPSEVELRELGEHISEASTSAGDCDESELLVRFFTAVGNTFQRIAPSVNLPPEISTRIADLEATAQRNERHLSRQRHRCSSLEDAVEEAGRDIDRLKDRVKHLAQERMEKDLEISKLRQELEDKTQTVNLLRKKFKVVAQQKSRRSHKDAKGSRDIDESLVVEG